mmetsp:Transcript_461/g.1062  ORF Transcript_461/g.1062 Transcript_461/m.1062 type:complete len:319 (-) Transcript_461:358-1314(-)
MFRGARGLGVLGRALFIAGICCHRHALLAHSGITATSHVWLDHVWRSKDCVNGGCLGLTDGRLGGGFGRDAEDRVDIRLLGRTGDRCGRECLGRRGRFLDRRCLGALVLLDGDAEVALGVHVEGGVAGGVGVEDELLGAVRLPAEEDVHAPGKVVVHVIPAGVPLRRAILSWARSRAVACFGVGALGRAEHGQDVLRGGAEASKAIRHRESQPFLQDDGHLFKVGCPGLELLGERGVDGGRAAQCAAVHADAGCHGGGPVGQLQWEHRLLQLGQVLAGHREGEGEAGVVQDVVRVLQVQLPRKSGSKQVIDPHECCGV